MTLQRTRHRLIPLIALVVGLGALSVSSTGCASGTAPVDLRAKYLPAIETIEAALPILEHGGILSSAQVADVRNGLDVARSALDAYVDVADKEGRARITAAVEALLDLWQQYTGMKVAPGPPPDSAS